MQQQEPSRCRQPDGSAGGCTFYQLESLYQNAGDLDRLGRARQIRQFYVARGDARWDRLPSMRGTPLDMCRLLEAVLGQGGVQAVAASQRWEVICTAVRLPYTSETAARLFKLYQLYLFDFEQAYRLRSGGGCGGGGGLTAVNNVPAMSAQPAPAAALPAASHTGLVSAPAPPPAAY
ncbi:unnamed protein product, partial [Phaeothamnion confervicola]